ncbi:hypothetical protein EES45_26660 [Streptomyces sp. ADI97-07]|uniref:Uncharacterized protein n=1 Tax=Streptomyces clavifer TaxID=68188 RepID=A0ABS4VDG1_9ACTN|nr:hypothetical protein [Streptomyces clavifer]RPK74701.1 hypothetical protein EES45_26660 [Streptomyces sp. ADI97-07]
MWGESLNRLPETAGVGHGRIRVWTAAPAAG